MGWPAIEPWLRCASAQDAAHRCWGSSSEESTRFIQLIESWVRLFLGTRSCSPTSELMPIWTDSSPELRFPPCSTESGPTSHRALPPPLLSPSRFLHSSSSTYHRLLGDSIRHLWSISSILLAVHTISRTRLHPINYDVKLPLSITLCGKLWLI